MKKYILAGALALVWVAVHTGFRQREKIRVLNKEIERQRGNISILENAVNHYEIDGQKKVAEIYGLRLKLDEYEQLRGKELAEIKKLRLKGRELESVINSKESTKIFVEVPVVDSIVIYKEVLKKDTLKCISFADPWINISGCLEKGVFKGSFVALDSLLIVESYKRRRFMGFLWKTKKVVNRKIDVLKASPYAQIDKVEYKKIER